jgi:purine-cytosine permease-like protein
MVHSSREVGAPYRANEIVGFEQLALVDSGPASKAVPREALLTFEHHGIECIPEEDRSSSIWGFIRLQWGGANSLATAVLGALPIILGLSVRQGALSILIGVTVGALILAPMTLFGPINGTNNAVSSSAHFGVVGRIVGSFLSLLTAIAFFAISVWSSGDALVGAAHRLHLLAETNLAFAMAYGVIALVVLLVCIYGFHLMMFLTKITVTISTALFVAGFVAFGPYFDSHFRGSGLEPGDAGFWPVFIGGVLIALANPISYGAFLGDWSRYLPRDTPPARLMGATIASQLMMLFPFSFGLTTASVIATSRPEYISVGNFMGGLLAISPGWFFIPLMVLALVSGLSTGTTSLYGTGLDFSSVFPSFSRARATLFIGSLSIALIFVGRFAFNLVSMISTLLALIIVMTTPWMIIMTLGYIFRRGFYRADDLQVFNRGQRGGAYWFRGGWNIAGMSAWIVSSMVSLLAVNIPGQYVGWLASALGGVDASIVVAITLPMILYPALLHVFPDPADVYGPEGPRWLQRPMAHTLESGNA